MFMLFPYSIFVLFNSKRYFLYKFYIRLFLIFIVLYLSVFIVQYLYLKDNVHMTLLDQQVLISTKSCLT